VALTVPATGGGTFTGWSGCTILKLPAGDAGRSRTVTANYFDAVPPGRVRSDAATSGRRVVWEIDPDAASGGVVPVRKAVYSASGVGGPWRHPHSGSARPRPTCSDGATSARRILVDQWRADPASSP
jgi:hypothetical protein